jgi:hypothetical protein
MFTRRGRPESAVLHFFIILFATTGGWIVLGTGLLIGGMIWGLNSHQVVYTQGGQGNYELYVSDDDSSICFQQGSTSNFYVMLITDYTPAVDPATLQNALKDHDRFSFIATSESIQLNSEIEGLGTLISSAHPIEQVTFYNSQGGNPITYTNTQYAGNPNGYTVNNWPFAAPMALVGAAGAGLALYLLLNKRRRQQQARAQELAELAAMPSPFARELGE